MLVNPYPYADSLHDVLDGESKRPRNFQGMEALVDADVFTYAAGFAVEHCEPIGYDEHGDMVGHWKNKQSYNTWAKKHPAISVHELDFLEWIEPLDKSELIINRKRKQIRDTTKSIPQRWYLTKGSTLWRNDDATIQEYKGNRKNMRKPVYYDDLRAYMERVCHAKVLKGLEADDGVAQLARDKPDKFIVVSGDKDLTTIPGNHLNPSKMKDGVYYVSPLEACRFLYSQMLMGDKIDNIKGLSGTKEQPGWGPVKATKAMSQFVTEADMAKFVAEQYAKTYPNGVIGYDGDHLTWEEMLVETANLLFLRRYHQVQFEWRE